MLLLDQVFDHSMLHSATEGCIHWRHCAVLDKTTGLFADATLKKALGQPASGGIAETLPTHIGDGDDMLEDLKLKRTDSVDITHIHRKSREGEGDARPQSGGS